MTTPSNPPAMATSEGLAHRLSQELCPLLAGLHLAAQASYALSELRSAADLLPEDSETIGWLRAHLPPLPDALALGGPDSAGAILSAFTGNVADLAARMLAEAQAAEA